MTGGSSCDDGNFYPRSPCGERRSNQPVTMRTWKFLSTLSLRRATGILAISLRIVFAEFLSTLSLRRATAFSFALLYSTTISIHALLAESDGILGRRLWYREQFLSTLSLRRATIWAFLSLSMICAFLSTLSLRRATRCDPLHGWSLEFLSTLSLRRATIIIHY